MAFLIAVEIHDLTSITLLLFFSSVDGIVTNGRDFLWFFNTFSSAFKPLLLVFFLAGSTMLLHGGTNFRFLVLSSLGREKSLVVVSWVYIFEVVLLEEQ